MLDETDRKIVNILTEDSRVSLRKIAQKAGISVATAMHRINNLKKEKIITKFTTLFDYEKMGYDIEVIIDVRISKGQFFDVQRKISPSPYVFAVYDTTGDFDALILARFPNRRKMDNFIKKIQQLDFVERTQTKLILNTLKEEGVGAHGL